MFNTNMVLKKGKMSGVKIKDIDRGGWFFFDDEVSSIGIRLTLVTNDHDGIPCVTIWPDENAHVTYLFAETVVFPIKNIIMEIQ